jgi:hypothetical protein
MTDRLIRILALSLTLAAPLGHTAAGELDGLAFIGPTGPTGKAAERADERVEFAAGRFRSSICEEMGFPPNAYRENREGEAVRFESLLVSEKDGTIRWQGIVRGGVLEATYTWTKEGVLWNTRREYWFKGAPAAR